MKRILPVGPETTSKGTHFRVYASNCKKVDVIHEKSASKPFPLKNENNGYFSGFVPQIKKNDRYRFRLNGKQAFPDPVSHFQPEGPLGPSQVIDHSEFKWTDKNWKGIQIEGQIFYEMHIGTFTVEGTYSAAEKELEELAQLGITTIELMPLADFPGQFGWGYDGVNLFAPTRLYGTPNDLKSFINAAHHHGIGVILDIVYNHFGPSGNFISEYAHDYFHEEETEWGQAIDFENPATLEFYLSNLSYWLKLFHFDGFRIDAIQGLMSNTLFEGLRKKLKSSAGKRSFILVGEDEPQDSDYLRPPSNKGFGLDALWNDDFHHTSKVRLTGSREGYYKDYTGTAQEFISCLKFGFLYQGQYYSWQKQNRGKPCLDINPSSFVLFIQNHDQVGNSPHGLRLHCLTDLGNLRAMTCLFLLAPSTPLLFQGQEFIASSPFLYFADHTDEIAKLIHAGRREFLSQFRHYATKDMQKAIPNPGDPSTFIKSKLDFSERIKNENIYTFHKDLIQLRKTDPVFSSQQTHIEATVFNEHAFCVRFFGPRAQERLLLVNFSIDLELSPAPYPLIAPPFQSKWEILFSTEAYKYGGLGIIPFLDMPVWVLTGHSAVLLKNTELLNVREGYE